MMGESVPLTSRLLRAAATAGVNLLVWLIIPYLLYGRLSQLEGSSGSSLGYSAFSLDLVYTFGAIITTLEVIGALTAGMAISVPFISGGYVASAYYIYVALNAGTLQLAASGLGLTIDFQPLMFLLLLPSMFNALKCPIEFLLERSEAGRAASEMI